MQRYLVLDTETTGLDPHRGDRLTEIAAVEVMDNIITGRQYQQYINPEREVSPMAQEITGYTWSMLRHYPTFGEVVDDFLAFVGDSKLVIHNAAFDMKFLNFQLSMFEKPLISTDRVIDTLLMARKKFPGGSNNLDALCKRFDISLEKRDRHGALIDSELLARVYIELIGGNQRKLELTELEQEAQELVRKNFPVRRFSLDDEEKRRHEEFLRTNLKEHMWGE